MCVGVLLAALDPGVVSAAKASTSVSFGGSRSLDVTLWYPDGQAVIRGVIVFTGGQSNGGSGDTRDRPDAAFWQAFGQSLGFGVLGTQFKGSYTNAADGPGQAVFDALRALGQQVSHPELANAPLLLEGFSNGGYFSFTFTQHAPERVIAFCLNKSGFAKAPLDAAFLAVPGFLIWGTNEPPDTPTVIHSLVQQGRAQHALWAELREWDASHEEGRVEPAFAPFFAEMVALRYPKDADPSKGAVSLLPLREESGWLGDHETASVEADVPAIAAWDAYMDDKSAASWLPSEGLAKLWRGYVAKRPLTLDQPKAGTRLDASKALQLSMSGLPDTLKVAEFFDQRAALVPNVAANGGKSTGSWQPAWGGVRGIAAVALGAAGEVMRVSRPAHVVLSGKDAPSPTQDSGHDTTMDPMTGRAADGGMPVAGNAVDGGVSDASVPLMARKDGGAAGSGPGRVSTPQTTTGASSLPNPGASDPRIAHNRLDDDAGLPDGSRLEGSCGCRVGPGGQQPGRRAGPLLLALLGLLGFGLRCSGRR